MNNKREIRVPFGILNIAGLMETKPVMDVDKIVGAEVVTPLFCHESYKIKATFNNKLDSSFGMSHEGYYQKKFRRMVLWDFGDGHTEEGYSVEHSYSKPGFYTVSCTFYDINRRAWKNTYSVNLVVKEILPTQLRFNDNFTKSSISCSKIEQIAKLEATLSTTCKEDLQVQAKRIFSEDEENSNYEEIGRKYTEIDSEIFKFSRKYWSFLENKQQLIFQSDKVFRDNLTPSDLYTPNYIQLYGNFYYDQFDKEEPIKILIYQVIPYKTIDDNLKTVRILNPNCKVDELLAHDGEYQDYLDKFTRVIDIQQVYLQEQLPQNVTPIGKRAWVDIFYKNDYLGNLNKFSFFYDIETKNITKELLSSDNYLNLMPIGLDIQVNANDVSLVNIGVSLDGFLRHISEGKQTIDEYLLNSLVKDTDIDFYFFPYIKYINDEVVIEGVDITVSDATDSDFTNGLTYYIPKDFNIEDVIITDTDKEGNSIWNNDRGVETIEPWLRRVNVILNDFIDFDVAIKIEGGNVINVKIHKNPLIKPDEIEIPTEKRVNEDVDTLIDVYMSHPMFDEAHTTKEFFTTILKGKDMLNYTLSRSKNFLDDHSNIKTCYLSNLIQTLKMMGEDIIEYEQGAFEGVNDLRDFVRILSMNHADLVGHEVKKEYEIDVQRDRMGRNVGDQLLIDDELTIIGGKIQTVKRDEKEYDFKELDSEGVEIIVQDKYTFDTKIVNLGLCGKDIVKIQNYEPSWGWNLLLPSRFDDCIYKLNQNKRYKAENGRDLYSQTELKRIQQVINQLIDGYYSFYVLNPQIEKERVGNFLSVDSINERINDPYEWGKEWGITHEILMKILRDNGGYKNTNIENYIPYEVRKNLNNTNSIIDERIKNISYGVYVNGVLDEDKGFDGKVEIFGYIGKNGVYNLYLRLIDGNVDGVKIHTVDEYIMFRVEVNDGQIVPFRHEVAIRGDGYEGEMTVKVCGKVEKTNKGIDGMLWDVSIDLYTDK